MRLVRWSRRAAVQFNSALDYAAGIDDRHAAKLSAAIVATAEALGRRPFGRRCERPGAFVKPVTGTRYLIVFALEPGPSGSVRILRVYHSAQNWTADPLDDA